MPAKKQPTNEHPKADEQAQEPERREAMPNSLADESSARPRDPEPDDMQTPKNYTPTGDAVPMDPSLSPEAQQPGEPYEDWLKRTGGPKPPQGVFDARVSRDDKPD